MHGLLNFSWNRKCCMAAAIAVALAGCSAGGKNSISFLLEQEKSQLRKVFAEKIGSNPTDVQRALDSSQAGEALRAKELSDRMVARLGRSKDKTMERHLQSVVERLTEPLNTHGVKYKVILVKDEQINAFTPGGGIIVVQEGLLMYCDTEGQVAAVLAHEIAHIVLRHPLRQSRLTIARKVGGKLVDTITPDALEDVEKMLRLGGKVSLNAVNRAQEAQADSIAIDIMVAAGYNPSEMVSVQRQFRQYAPQASRLANLIYGSHPLSKDREELARKKVESNYASVRGTITTHRYEKLIENYQQRRMNRMAAKL